LLLVAFGLVLIAGGRLWLGLALVGIGRICDILDGAAAEVTGTKSPLGEALDASFDKIEAFAALIILAAVGALPWGVAVAVLAHNIFVAAVSLVARYRRLRIHPLAAGKITGFIEWIAIMAFIARAAAHGHAFAIAAGTVGYLLTAAALVLGVYAAIGYTRAALGGTAPRTP
jgi:phosphatidylglycerophosphate synthase